MITSSVIACIRGASANGRAERPAVDLALGGVGDHLRVALDRLAVEGRQQQLALAHVARAERGEDRVGADDRPQRRLAGQRGRLLGLGGEERAHVVGMAGDRPGRRASTSRMRKTSPSSRRAPKTNSIWRWLKRRICSSGGSWIDGRRRQRRRLARLDRAGGRGRAPRRRGRSRPRRRGGGCGDGARRAGLTRSVLHRSMSYQPVSTVM